MRLLAFDPGAERLGWASLAKEDGRIDYHMSGIITVPRGSTAFQTYRLELTGALSMALPTLFSLTEPDLIVSETLPPIGFNNSVQSYLANVAISVVHASAQVTGIPYEQIAANTVKKIVTGNSKATKVRVRNAVVEKFQINDPSWKTVFDETDAIAIGWAHLQKYL